MTDQTGGDQPQKTVAELLAQHGAQVDGGSRRRRRRAAEDDDEVGTPDAGGTGTHRRPSVSDTGSQAIIDRVNADNGGMPPARAAAPRRRPEPQPPAPPVPPRPAPQESQQLPRPVAPPPARPATEASGYQRMPQESGQYARPPQEAGGYQRMPQESQQLPVPPRPPRRQPPPAPPQPSQQLPVPQPSKQLPVPPSAEETRAVPPVAPPTRRRPAAQPPAPPAPAPPTSGALSARLDGLNGTPDAELDGPPMASGQFATPPPPAPQRPRRAPARRPQPKEAHTEQFSKVSDDVDVPPPPAPPKPKPKPNKSATPDISSPAGLANWRKRRQKEQLEDTEIGVMPAVPVDDEFGDDGFAPESSGYQAAYDAGPPTGTYPPPMPFAPDERGARPSAPDDLSEYEREFAEPVGYPADGPDFDRDDYGYEQGEDYEDEYDEDVAEPAPEPAVAASPGKAWLALAGQLALGVVGGAAVWLGFNWLWVNLPAAALVAALLVVVALVWIVRKIRRAEDLQTTVLAVLVGLVVTVSPAALLLVGR
jgi:hypothetical protein